MAKLSDIRLDNPSPTASGNILFFGEASDGTPLAFTLDEIKAYIDAVVASTSIATTATISASAETDYMVNNTGKISFNYANGSAVTDQYHGLSNSEIAIPENGKTVNATAKVTMFYDSTLSLVKNGDYANPLITVSSTTIPDDVVPDTTRYVCDLALNDIPVAGGDLLTLSLDVVDPADGEFQYVHMDSSKTFFTIEVTEVLA